MRYGDAEQQRDYRRAAREAGCICSESLPPHVHDRECPAWVDFPDEVPSQVPSHGENPGSEDRSAAYGTEREGAAQAPNGEPLPSRAGVPIDEALRELDLTLNRAIELLREFLEYLDHLEEEHRQDEELR